MFFHFMGGEDFLNHFVNIRAKTGNFFILLRMVNSSARSLTTIVKKQLKYDCVDGSIVNRNREPISDFYSR